MTRIPFTWSSEPDAVFSARRAERTADSRQHELHAHGADQLRHCVHHVPFFFSSRRGEHNPHGWRQHMRHRQAWHRLFRPCVATCPRQSMPKHFLAALRLSTPPRPSPARTEKNRRPFTGSMHCKASPRPCPPPTIHVAANLSFKPAFQGLGNHYRPTDGLCRAGAPRHRLDGFTGSRKPQESAPSRHKSTSHSASEAGINACRRSFSRP